MNAPPVDAVYTWVDDSIPGYMELLRSYSTRTEELNPNRTRDNLECLRFSLRTLERHAPWIRRIYLLTMRPQLPTWLRKDHPRLRVVHHDEIMDPGILPTFNSFVMVAHLHRLPGLSERFIYLEDDKLLGGPVRPADLFTEDGRPRIYLERRSTRAGSTHASEHDSSWNACLAYANHVLDQRYGRKLRASIKYAPLAMTRSSWSWMEATFGSELDRTRATRFRTPGTVAPEFLYPYALLAEGMAQAVPYREGRRRLGYHAVNNIPIWNALRLARLRLRRPTFLNLNDDFGHRPSATAVRQAKRFLHHLAPDTSSFERPDPGHTQPQPNPESRDGGMRP